MTLPTESDEMLGRARQQVRLLLAAARRFDAGGEHAGDEALTMAVPLRTLLHQTASSTAALTHTGHLSRMRFVDSLGSPSPSGPGIGALQQVIDLNPPPGGRHVRFQAPLGHHLRRLTPGAQAALILNAPGFTEWWQERVLLRDLNRREFTRRQIVLAVANKDGGAHIDEKLPASYRALRNEPDFGLSITLDDDVTHRIDSPVPPLLRQITFEFERSLRSTGSDLLP